MAMSAVLTWWLLVCTRSSPSLAEQLGRKSKSDDGFPAKIYLGAALQVTGSHATWGPHRTIESRKF